MFKRRLEMVVAGWLGVFVLGGCGSTSDSQRTLVQPQNAQSGSRAERTEHHAAAGSNPVSSSAAALGGADPARPPPSPPNAATAQPLPTDAAYVLRSLGPFNPARHARFAEHSRIGVGKGQLQGLALGTDPDVVWVSSGDEASVRAYSRSSKRLLATVPIPDIAPTDPRALVAWPSFGKAGELLFVVGTERGLTRLSSSKDFAGERMDSSPVHGLRWSPDWNILIASTSDVATQTSVLTFYQRFGNILKPIARQPFDERVDGYALSPDNRLLALSHYPSGDVRVLDLATKTDLLRMPGPNFNGDVEFSPDGRYLAVGGAGLLVIDLLNPARRAFYSHLGNNIAHVHFSPSGDAIVASSFDGRLRLFELRDVPLPPGAAPRDSGAGTSVVGLELALLTTLRHEGTANVYDFVFTPDGALVSASGDRTLREFRTPVPEEGPSTQRFRTLEQWRAVDPAAANPWPNPPAPPLRDGHYLPDELSGPALPSQLRSGSYACKISEIYKLRECVVSRDEGGHTLLSFGAGNLLELDAVAFTDGDVTRLTGWLTRESSIVACRGCEKQPLHGLLRGGAGNRWKGVLTFRNYYDPYVLPPRPAADVKLEETLDSFPIELRYLGPSQATTSRRSE